MVYLHYKEVIMILAGFVIIKLSAFSSNVAAFPPYYFYASHTPTPLLDFSSNSSAQIIQQQQLNESERSSRRRQMKRRHQSIDSHGYHDDTTTNINHSGMDPVTGIAIGTTTTPATYSNNNNNRSSFPPYVELWDEVEWCRSKYKYWDRKGNTNQSQLDNDCV